MFNSILKIIRGIVKLRGNTDGTLIGNVSDELKVIIGATSEFHAHEDFFLEVARGNVAGHNSMSKFGYNISVGSTSREDIWDQGGLYPWPTSAATVTIKSNDADDTSAGTGARTLEIEGLDSSWDLVIETITMNGTTDVTTTNSYRRIYRMTVKTSGSSETNEGQITATHTATIIAVIEANNGQTFMAIYTIPNGKTGYFYDYYFTSENSLPATMDLLVRPFNGSWNSKHRLEIGGSVVPQPFRVPLKFEAKTDIRMNAIAHTGNNRMAAGFNLVLVDD